IERYGGQVLTRKRVTEIVCDEEKATEVTCEDGSSYVADIVISDAHPSVTVELVKSHLFRPAYRKRIQDIPNTVGGFAVYLHFKENEVPYMNYNFYGYNQSTPWGCENYDTATWPKGYLYMHLCEEEGQKYAKSGVILSYMQMKDVEKWKGTKVGRRGKEYEEFKHQHAEKLLDSLEKEFPGLRSHIASYTTSTPLTYLDYTGTPGGSMYGVAKDVHAGAAARVHHRTKIPNLLLTGQNINSHGILGVLVGTMVTCGEVIGSEQLFHQIVNDKKSVVIGGGLGGLFTGALLAKEGYQVTVIEKNRVIGGGLQTFSRHGVNFETGMHLLGGIRKDGAIYKICEYLGIMKDLKIHDVDADCMDEITYISDGKTYHIPEGKENFIRYFQSEFPEEKQGIRDYVEELYHIVDEIDFFYLRTENEHIYSHDEKFYWPADKI
ncbi:MAG: FAD-dependent oxidoreductase, partial [Lachnospiraceae bacterium]|nr:FAD-dependent oxidoreductase [Lachnospiraceae bacterium]